MADDIKRKRRVKRKISAGHRKVHAEMEPFKTIGKDGKPKWDVEAAEKNNQFIKKFLRRYSLFSDKRERYWRFRGLLYKLEEQIQKGYLRVFDFENRLMDYARIKDEFGNIKKLNQACDEIRDLIEAGAEPKKHSRRLERKYHQGRRALDNLWKEISEGRL